MAPSPRVFLDGQGVLWIANKWRFTSKEHRDRAKKFARLRESGQLDAGSQAQLSFPPEMPVRVRLVRDDNGAEVTKWQSMTWYAFEEGRRRAAETAKPL